MKVAILAGSAESGARILQQLPSDKRIEIIICLIGKPWELIVQVIAGLIRRKPWAAQLLRARFHFIQDIESDGSKRWLEHMNFDVGLHAAPIIYRRSTISHFRLGILNAHIGILPRYRGRSVFEWAILEGGPTGVSVFFIDEGIDTGPRVIHNELYAWQETGALDEQKRQLFAQDGRMYSSAIIKLLKDQSCVLFFQEPSAGLRFYAMSGLLRNVLQKGSERD